MGRFWALLGAATAALEEPYPYLHGGNWTGDASSFVDPMRAYAWTTRNRSFQVFFDAPVATTSSTRARACARSPTRATPSAPTSCRSRSSS